MRSLRNLLAGTIFAGILICLTSGCGGSSELAKPPDPAKSNPPMSAMPGFDEKTGKMKTTKTK